MKRHELREKSMIAIYQNLLVNTDIDELIRTEFEKEPEEIDPYFNAVIHTAVSHKDEYAGYIDQVLDGWTFERLGYIEKAILLLGCSEFAEKKVEAAVIIDECVELAKKYGCSLILSGHSTMNTSRYTYFAPSISKIMATKIVKFYANELAEDVGSKMMRTRYHAYPIVDENDRIVGCASRYHIMNSKNKKIILVDHNEFSQSVRAIDKAEVLEVIDHHRINDFSTKRPVAFRNEIIGSTATIVATMFRENQIPIPQNLAGLLLGAILSDTLKFQSPTTTEKDKRTANILAAIADLDIDEFASEMFSVGADIKGKSIPELLNQDIKYFEIENCKTMVSQVIISTFKALEGKNDEIQSVLDEFTKKKNLDLCLMVFTSILDNGSIVFRSGDKSDWALEAFPDNDNESHSLQKGILSRKSQIVPILTATIQKYS